MKRHNNKLLLATLFAGIFLLTGCGGGGGDGVADEVGTGGGGGGETPPNSRFEFTLTSYDPAAVVVPGGLSNGLSVPTSNQLAILVEGTILAVRQTTGEEHEFNFAVEVDPGAFTVTDVEVPLPSGTYDVYFLMTKGSFQYAAITGSRIILDGQNVVPMLIAPLFGQTVSGLEPLKRLTEFEFIFTDAELQKVRAAANPRFSIEVLDNIGEIKFAVNPATGLTTAFASLAAGTYELHIRFYDGEVLIAEQVITVTILEGGGKISIDIDLKKPVADTGLDQSVHQGDDASVDGTDSSSSQGTLTYQWSFFSKPPGSTATLDDPTAVNPTFTADLAGDYVLQLIVTDENDVESEPEFITVTTFNTTPVADPGDGGAITVINDTVELDGRASFDEDGDVLRYEWTLTPPAGSGATLFNATSATPSFIADVKGDYVLTLVVTDAFEVSEVKTVTYTFDNVAPIAVASTDTPSANVGTVVTLDGGGSSDANLDGLTYSWTQTDGVAVVLNNPATINPTFTPDVAGAYIFSLVVSDGEVVSDPSNVKVVAVETGQTTIEILGDLIDAIESLEFDAFGQPHHHGKEKDHDDDHDEIHDHHHHNHRHSHHFKHWKHKRALVHKVLSVIHKLDEGKLEKAKKKLERNILRKVDGCGGLLESEFSPDKRDWIVTCEAQSKVYPLVLLAIDKIEDSLAGN